MNSESSLSALPLARFRHRPAVRLLSPWHAVAVSLVGLDAFAITSAFALAYVIRFKAGLPLLSTPPYTLSFYSSVAFWAVPVWIGLFMLYRLYDRRGLFVGFDEYVRVVHACSLGTFAVVVMSFLDITLAISRGWLILTWLFAILFVSSERFAGRRMLRQLRQRGFLLTPMVVVGANQEGVAIAEQFLADRGSGATLLGFVDAALPAGSRVAGGLSVLGSLTDLPRLTASRDIHEIVVATTALSRDELLDLYRTFGHESDLEIRLSSGVFEILTTGVRVQEISAVPLITPERTRITGVDALLKSTLDYVAASLGLLLLSPLLLVIALLIKLDSPGPVLYRRRVVGRSGRTFDALKFRSMGPDRRVCELPIGFPNRRRRAKAVADPRVTRVGRFLRRSSLDELPQLVNVLRGEMSLIGPRMISPEEAPLYGKWQLNLLTVKPGITGPWQVRGRSDLAYEERVRLSMNYIRNYSIWLDLEILLRTVPAVLHARGAY
jgi:exopolysaccharide biosynthesis polyprenyl glycosylphosphotransferase